MVREALVWSVACTAPPVRCHTSQLSIVPAASSPRSARARSPGRSSSHSSLVPLKYGSVTRPVRSRIHAASPARVAHRSAVRRSCHTMARCTASPVRRSHSTTVSRWLVIPTATGVVPASAIASRAASRTPASSSCGSCSTHPGRG
jgi:hypothetical protein